MLDGLAIQRGGDKPVSTQLAEFVKFKIKNKELRPGQKLPATTEMVKLTGIGSQSVRKAMKELENEGLIESTRGRGTFVKDNSKDSDKITKLSIFGAFCDDIEHTELLYPFTIAGAFSECQKRNVSANIASPYISFGSAADIVKFLKSEDFQAVLWLYPSDDEIDKLNAIEDAGISVVVASFSSVFKKFSGVSTYELEGAMGVVEYYKSSGCKEVRVLAEANLNLKHDNREHGGSNWAETLAIAARSVNDAEDISFTCSYSLPLEYHNYNIALKNKLSELPAGSGVFLVNDANLSQALYDTEVCDLLAKLTVCFLSVGPGNKKLLPLVPVTPFKILSVPVRKIGKVLIQKLLVEDFEALQEGFIYISNDLIDSSDISK